MISGYVGNKAAVFPLQLLGFDVDILPSVTLANHTAYTHGALGPRHTPQQVATWMDGLCKNGLLAPITHLLTGYIGTSATLSAIVDAIALLKKGTTHDLFFVCDPVMGDDGKMYVDADVVDVYVQRVLPLVTILTPNAYELSLLTSCDINNRESAFSACDLLHDKYQIPVIIVTGTRFDESSDKVAVLVSAKRKGESNSRFTLEADFIDGSFTGSGDLLSALLLAWISRLPDDLVTACRNAMASVTAVLKRTIDHAHKSEFCKKPELRLIQSQHDLFNPPVKLVTVQMSSP